MKSWTTLVHLDLKGAPLKLSYIRNLIPVLKIAGCNGFLIEYEDMFPYKDDIAVLARDDAYSIEDLSNFIEYCNEQDLEIIPLIQTFGHLEYVLKHESFRYLRENYKNPMSICPNLTATVTLIRNMIDQILCLHKYSKYIHIGADEVTDLNSCQNCKILDIDNYSVYLNHIKEIATYVRDAKSLTAIMWDDMLREIPESVLQINNLSKFVDVMIWNYTPILSVSDEHFMKIAKLFPRIWGASAFKGANGPITQLVNTSVYVKNNQSWLNKISQINAMQQGQFVGIALTGWSRFDHFASLCEILPAAIPCLILCLKIVTTGIFTKEIHKEISEQLGFPELIPWEPHFNVVDPSIQLNFPGYQIYQGVSGWFLLNTEAKLFLSSDLIQGWLSKYHRKKLIGNSATIFRIVSELDRIHSRFNDWKHIFTPLFREIFLDSAVTEWIEYHVVTIMHKVKKISKEGHKLIALGDSVFDRPGIEAGDN